MWGIPMRSRAVVMRPIVEAEISLLVAWSADPEVLRFVGTGYHAMAPAEVKKWWEEAGTDQSAFHWGLEWEGRLVGRTAIEHIDWQDRLGWTETVVGDKSAWGQGIATQAVGMRSDYAFRQLYLHKLDSFYADGNPGGAEVQRRAGYHKVARLREQLYRDGRWFDEIWTELLREDWEREHPLT